MRADPHGEFVGDADSHLLPCGANRDAGNDTTLSVVHVDELNKGV